MLLKRWRNIQEGRFNQLLGISPRRLLLPLLFHGVRLFTSRDGEPAGGGQLDHLSAGLLSTGRCSPPLSSHREAGALPPPLSALDTDLTFLR